MGLWLLKRLECPRYPEDMYHGFVIRADTEELARNTAAFEDRNAGRHGESWKDKNRTSCVPLSESGDAEIVLGDYFSG